MTSGILVRSILPTVFAGMLVAAPALVQSSKSIPDTLGGAGEFVEPA